MIFIKRHFQYKLTNTHKYIVDFNASKMPKLDLRDMADNRWFRVYEYKPTTILIYTIALWSDFGDIPPTQNRSFRKIISVYDIDSFNIKMIVKGYDYSNKIREIVILFDSHAKEVRLIYSRSVEAKRI